MRHGRKTAVAVAVSVCIGMRFARRSFDQFDAAAFGSALFHERFKDALIRRHAFQRLGPRFIRSFGNQFRLGRIKCLLPYAADLHFHIADIQAHTAVILRFEEDRRKAHISQNIADGIVAESDDVIFRFTIPTERSLGEGRLNIAVHLPPHAEKRDLIVDVKQLCGNRFRLRHKA